MYIVGTPLSWVISCLRMSSSASAGSNLGCSTRVAPTRKVVFSETLWPNTWNSGRQPRTLSSRRVSLASKAFTVAFRTRLRWVSTAPLGRPVVPLV